MLLAVRNFFRDASCDQSLFDELGERLPLIISGTIVDATIIAAPSSTKNADKARDPDMHQAKKGNEWHFGMKAHIGVDTHSGLVHTVATTPANVNDLNMAGALLHGDEEVAFVFVGDEAGLGD